MRFQQGKSMLRWLDLMSMTLAPGLAGNFGFFAECFISNEQPLSPLMEIYRGRDPHGGCATLC